MPKNAVSLAEEFLEYCKTHPDQRFWQALCNWSNLPLIETVAGDGSREDTWNWKGKGRA
jgi:hypothetical protein